MILWLTVSRGNEVHQLPRNRHDPTKDSAFPHFLKQGDKANQTNSRTYKQVLVYRHQHGQRYSPWSPDHGREENQMQTRLQEITLAGRRRRERSPLSLSTGEEEEKKKMGFSKNRKVCQLLVFLFSAGSLLYCSHSRTKGLVVDRRRH